MSDFRNKLIAAGVRNLKEFGYPHATELNILTDLVYSQFFERMLKENKGHSTGVDQAIDGLLEEIAAAR
jgi:hypothetical protein